MTTHELPRTCPAPQRGLLVFVLMVSACSHAMLPSQKELLEDAASPAPNSRRRAAGDTDTPPKILTRLARDEVADVRRAVAENKSCPPEVLAALARDSDAKVRNGVAGNPHTPAENYVMLARDPDENVRASVARNAQTPLDILTALARDPASWVRYSVAMSPNVSAGILESLVTDSDKEVCAKAASSPRIGREALVRLASNQDAADGVAGNPSTPSSVLADLARAEVSAPNAKHKRLCHLIANPALPSEHLKPLYEKAHDQQFDSVSSDSIFGIWALSVTKTTRIVTESGDEPNPTFHRFTWEDLTKRPLPWQSVSYVHEYQEYFEIPRNDGILWVYFPGQIKEGKWSSGNAGVARYEFKGTPQQGQLKLEYESKELQLTYDQAALVAGKINGTMVERSLQYRGETKRIRTYKDIMLRRMAVTPCY